MSRLYKTSRAQVRPAVVNQRLVYVVDSSNPEVALAKALRVFLETVGFSNIFPNFDNVRVGTIHPFAILIAQEVLEQPQKVNVFPSVTIADTAMDEDVETLADDYAVIPFTVENIASLGGYRDSEEVFTSDAGWTKIVETVMSNGTIVGIKKCYHSSHTMDFNIWSENKEVTSFLYDMVCHFITQERVALHGRGIDFAKMSGRRSGDINLDFGMLLYGANIRVQAMTHHEAVLFDTGITTIEQIDVKTLPQYFASGGA